MLIGITHLEHGSQSVEWWFLACGMTAFTTSLFVPTSSAELFEIVARGKFELPTVLCSTNGSHLFTTSTISYCVLTCSITSLSLLGSHHVLYNTDLNYSL